jgi:hypothetical protein
MIGEVRLHLVGIKLPLGDFMDPRESHGVMDMTMSLGNYIHYFSDTSEPKKDLCKLCDSSTISVSLTHTVVLLNHGQH